MKRAHIKILNRILVLLIVAFILNLLWESGHYWLYECKIPFGTCVFVSAIRDAFIILGIFGVGALVFRDWRWTFRWQRSRVFFMAAASLVVAWIIEVQGLVLGKWEYAEAMPIIPVLNVGVSPILQMVVLAPLIFFITERLLQRAFN